MSFRATGLAIEEGGATALVTTDTGLLARLDLSTLTLTELIAWGLANPVGVAIEPGGKTALVAESVRNRLIRVDLVKGTVTPIATGLTTPQMGWGDIIEGVAVEPGGQTALAGANKRLMRVTLATGAVQDITNELSSPRGIAIEASGTTALMTDDEKLVRVELATGRVSVVATQSTVGALFAGGIAIEPGGGTALATVGKCLVRVNLANGEGTGISCHFNNPGALAIEAGGRTALVGEQTRVVRVHLASSISRVDPALEPAMAAVRFVDVAIEAGARTALVVNCWGEPRLLRVDLTSGAATTIVSFEGQYYSIYGLAIGPGGKSALVTADIRNLVRINLADGSATTITRLLQYAQSVAIEPGGGTALVGDYDLYRVDLATGAVTVVVAGGMGSGYVAIEPGGATALVTRGSDYSLLRVDLTTGKVTTIASDLATAGPYGWRGLVAIEEGGRSALVTQSLAMYREGRILPEGVSGRILRVDLATGAVTVVVPSGLYGSGTAGIAIEPGGATALVADYDNGLVRVVLPQAP